MATEDLVARAPALRRAASLEGELQVPRQVRAGGTQQPDPGPVPVGIRVRGPAEASAPDRVRRAVSALDLSTQARVLDLFRDIQDRTGVAYLFVSHDLAVVRHLSHRVAVMYQGEIVEWGDGDQVTSAPKHPYTQQLFLSAPIPDPVKQAARREALLELKERNLAEAAKAS